MSAVNEARVVADYKRAQSIVGTNNDGGRPENDFYPTPPEATQKLLDVEVFGGGIWEPACGDGSITRVLRRNGYYVFESDIEPRNDGLELDFMLSDQLRARSIVTNPPFKIAQQFAQHALDLGCDKLALLCKLSFLEGGTRGQWFPQTPLKNVYVFSKRLTMTRNGEPSRNGGMIAFAWYVWERGYNGRPMIGWL